MLPTSQPSASRRTGSEVRDGHDTQEPGQGDRPRHQDGFRWVPENPARLCQWKDVCFFPWPGLGRRPLSSCLQKDVAEDAVDHIQRLVALQNDVVGIQVLPPPLFHLP